MNINHNILQKFNILQDIVLQYYHLEENPYKKDFYHRGIRYRINVIHIGDLGYDTAHMSGNKLDYNGLMEILKFLRDNYPHLVPFYTFCVYFLYPYIDLHINKIRDIFVEMNYCIENIRIEVKKEKIINEWRELLVKHRIIHNENMKSLT